MALVLVVLVLVSDGGEERVAVMMAAVPAVLPVLSMAVGSVAAVPVVLAVASLAVKPMVRVPVVLVWVLASENPMVLILVVLGAWARLPVAAAEHLAARRAGAHPRASANRQLPDSSPFPAPHRRRASGYS